MKVFVSNAESFMGKAVVRRWQAEAKRRLEEDEGAGALTITASSASGEIEGVDAAVLGSDDAVELALGSDVLVLDLVGAGGEASSILQALRERILDRVPSGAVGSAVTERVLVGVSSVVTWEASRGARKGTLKESQWRERRCGASAEGLKVLEGHVLACGREGVVRAQVVCCGAAYGCGEGALRDLFRQAWLGEGPVRVSATVRRGRNDLSLVHVDDAASIVVGVGLSAVENSVVLAVDQGNQTLSKVAKAVAKALGGGEVEMVVEGVGGQSEETQMDVKFEVGSCAAHDGTLAVEWKYGEGILERLNDVVGEFLAWNNLRPVRTAIIGPPCAGKTTLAQTIAEEYALDIVTPPLALQELRDQAAKLRPLPSEPQAVETDDAAPKKEDDNEEEEEAAQEEEEDEATKIIRALHTRVSAKQSVGARLSRKLLAQVLRWSLTQPRRRNRGWILDGFPRDYAEAANLWKTGGEFVVGEDDEGEEGAVSDDPPAPGGVAQEKTAEDDEEAPQEEEEEDTADIECDPSLLPNVVLLLDAPDQTLLESFSSSSSPSSPSSPSPETSESDAAESPQDRFQRRLATWRKWNPTDGIRTARTFIERHAKVQVLTPSSSSSSSTSAILETVQPLLERGGRPFNFHPTEEELEQRRELQTQQSNHEQIQHQKIEQEKAEQERQERQARDQEHQQRLRAVAEHEAQLLEARSAPLRKWLADNVLPSVSEGLLEIASVQPDDPVDYLAEFLFRKATSASN